MISIGDIYNKDVNFLFGSGASFGVLPTLKLGIQKDGGESWSLEELATHFEREDDKRFVPLFMHYYNTCIQPAHALSVESASQNEIGKTVIGNYRTFLETVLGMLQRREVLERRCNLFTTNYDGCFPLVADEMLRTGTVDFVLNDGARGFTKRFLQARNFNSFMCQSGIFDRHLNSIPQINLIHLHGSVYWRKESKGIRVDYSSAPDPLLDAAAITKLEPFSTALGNSSVKLSEIDAPNFSADQLTKFWAEYQKTPIVNPTKWKFHETVYEEHYYQMLRLLSYELEKPNAILITFGFSFADEHILNLVRRSLSNPRLQVFVCCFDDANHQTLSREFQGHRNVKCLKLDDGPLDFTAFNKKVFSYQESPLGTLGTPGPHVAPAPHTAPASGTTAA